PDPGTTMEIAVLVKPVPEAETRLRIASSGRALDTEGIKWVLAGYDESAVEQALLLKEAIAGSRVRVLAFGPAPRTEEVLRASIALGCDQAVWIELPAEMAPDPILVARAIGSVLSKSPTDLILTGKHAGDDEAGLVGSALGELLDLPSFGGVTDLRWDAGRARFTFHRIVEGGVESIESPPHVVIGLQQAWNDPRTAKLPNILKSRKAPIEKIPWLAVEAACRGVAPQPSKFRLPAPRTGAKMIEYKTPQEAAETLVRLLKEEAKVFP
ncbi:MAG: electron transfer flavoprotein subunit beta/FixA family protein, partial [Thermoplasmata archaeon]|nr:electron transfer flavoprotein subunit beta/FixA family protein [Thermoplasmata archaeon]